MHWADALIFILYSVAMLGVGFFFLRKNSNEEDYYAGGRNLNKWHIGLSVVATDVGGGFSIGLGGLGFTMGLSGSWMLFTGLIGAWMASVLLIPKVFPLGRNLGLLTFPELMGHYFNKRVAMLAAWISLIGYLGFTSSQLLAGAKLASATFPTLSLSSALWIMGLIAVVYTVMGGLKAVIYTDTVQWIILIAGLAFLGIPMGFHYLGGWEGLKASVSPEMVQLNQVSFIQLINWSLTIIPIWFVGMTLYQRIYASRNLHEATRAWFIAGLFEWPLMAFLGTFLGLMAKAAFAQGLIGPDMVGIEGELDPEMGLPIFLRQVLPVGAMGLLMSAYFSAVLSTADSCLMAASGNLITDILGYRRGGKLWVSQLITLLIGFLAILIGSQMSNVLDLMLNSYAFMVSGLLIPVLAALFDRKATAQAAMAALLVGGLTSLGLGLSEISLPLGLDPIAYGLLASIIAYLIVRPFHSQAKPLIHA